MTINKVLFTEAVTAFSGVLIDCGASGYLQYFAFWSHFHFIDSYNNFTWKTIHCETAIS